MESRLGRLRATVSGDLSRSLGPTERMKTPEFRAIECRLATLDPHARCNDVVNLVCRRSAASGDLVSAHAEYEDVVREGLAAEALFAAACAEALGSRGVRLADDGSVADHSAADALTSSAPCERVRYDPGADPASLSGADLELSNFVERHDRGKDPRKAIAGPFSAEADASRVVYAGVDDVLTHRQARSRDAAERRGGQRPGEWAFHSVAHVEADGEALVLEARTQAECYARMYACLLESGLAGREVVLPADGEETLKTMADDVLSAWPHASYLD